MKFCSECGSKVEGLKFCPQCGLKLDQSVKSNNAQGTNNVTTLESSKREPLIRRTWFLIVTCIFIPPVGTIFVLLSWRVEKGNWPLRIGLAFILVCYSLVWYSTYFGNYSSLKERNTQATSVIENASDSGSLTTVETSSPSENTAIYTKLYSGKWIVGTDIQPGRYSVTSDFGSGIIYFYDADGFPNVTAWLSHEDTVLTVIECEVTLEIGESIEISGMDRVVFEPTERYLRTTLPTGDFEVGIDIPAGTYDVTTPSGSGMIYFYDADGFPDVTAWLSHEASEYTVTQVHVSLEDGDKIEIYNMDAAVFQ